MTNREVEEVEAAGGIVYRIREDAVIEILLIHRNGVWDLPKGKREKGESMAMCAAREVAEEVGSGIPAIVNFIDTTYHKYQEKEKLIGKTTWWYVMIFTRDEDLVPQTKEGIEEIAWVKLGEAKESVGYKNLEEILSKFESEFK